MKNSSNANHSPFNHPSQSPTTSSQAPRLLQTATITQIASFLGLTKETLYRIRHNNY